MKFAKIIVATGFVVLLTVGALSVGVIWPLASAQDKQEKATDSAEHKHVDAPATVVKDLPTQVYDLQAQIAKLEAAMKEAHTPSSSGKADPGEKKGMSMGMMASEPKMEKCMCMAMGGQPKTQPGVQTLSAFDGFGAGVHLYPVGAADFFLDHAEHTKLTAKQHTDLNRIKEKTLLAFLSGKRKIDEVEQSLWTITSTARPDAAKIEHEVREIERLRGDQRISFIQGIAEAAEVLTEEQRQSLLGTGTDNSDPHAGHH